MSSCRSVRNWLHVDTETLSEAQRLVLEEHLAGCRECQIDRACLLRARTVGASLPTSSIGPRGHARVIAEAMIQGRRSPAAVTRRPAPWWAFAISGAAVAGAVAVYLAVRSDGAVFSAPAIELASAPSEHLSPAPSPLRQQVEAPASIAEIAVVDGTLMQGKTALPLASELPVDATLRAATSVRVVAASMTVVVASSSYIRRSAIEREIVLERGSVDVTADAGRIATAAFTVEVNGDASITPGRITVRRGTVRVLAPDGRVLAATLVAPASWQPTDLPATAKPSAAALLDVARAAFTARDYVKAARSADAALDASPTRMQTAEARTMLAECALANGTVNDAIARYEAIAAGFADLSAGEMALFAAARLQSSRDRQAARELFERYLERYPSGRFAADARRQLRAP